MSFFQDNQALCTSRRPIIHHFVSYGQSRLSGLRLDALISSILDVLVESDRACQPFVRKLVT